MAGAVDGTAIEDAMHCQDTTPAATPLALTGATVGSQDSPRRSGSARTALRSALRANPPIAFSPHLRCGARWAVLARAGDDLRLTGDIHRILIGDRHVNCHDDPCIDWNLHRRRDAIDARLNSAYVPTAGCSHLIAGVPLEVRHLVTIERVTPLRRAFATIVTAAIERFTDLEESERAFEVDYAHVAGDSDPGLFALHVGVIGLALAADAEGNVRDLDLSGLRSPEARAYVRVRWHRALARILGVDAPQPVLVLKAHDARATLFVFNAELARTWPGWGAGLEPRRLGGLFRIHWRGAWFGEAWRTVRARATELGVERPAERERIRTVPILALDSDERKALRPNLGDPARMVLDHNLSASAAEGGTTEAADLSWIAPPNGPSGRCLDFSAVHPTCPCADCRPHVSAVLRFDESSWWSLSALDRACRYGPSIAQAQAGEELARLIESAGAGRESADRAAKLLRAALRGELRSEHDRTSRGAPWGICRWLFASDLRAIRLAKQATVSPTEDILVSDIDVRPTPPRQP